MPALDDNILGSEIPPLRNATAEEIDRSVDEVIRGASIDEKIAMMSGRGFFAAFREDGGVWGARPYRAGSGLARLGIAPLFFTDGPRGVARGSSTCFPCSMARGATFDVDLEYRIGEIMGIETRAQDCTLNGAVCMNILRHPAWGRAQETYGEDSWHLGKMGTALGLGIQAHNVIATVKHFALNSIENTRFTVDVKVEEVALHEVYLPHYKMALDAGVASVMSAYNRVNGEYCGQHRHLLTDILRGEWGFEGFVHSDWVKGVYETYGAYAGLDIENPEPVVFGDRLKADVEAGTIDTDVIDQACRRILRTQFRFSSAEDPLPEYHLSLVARPQHVEVALEAALKSAVLLENNGALPLDRARLATIAVLGSLAARKNTGDNGSSRVNAPSVTTVLDGIRRAFDGTIVEADEADLDAATRAAAKADVSVVVVGYTADDEGEYLPGDIDLGSAIPSPEPGKSAQPGSRRPGSRGGDRLSLDLPVDHVRLIEAAVAGGKPVIVVIVAGSAVMVEGWRVKADAIVQTFYSGMEGGTALAKLLFGEVAPSGKLPFTVAAYAEDYPAFDPFAEVIEYDYWHGYAKFDRESLQPRYAFGHGLSYTTFAFSELQATQLGEEIVVSISVENTGKVRATEVVQCYIGFPSGSAAERPKKVLRGFDRVELDSGQRATVRLIVPIDSLRRRDPATHSWCFEGGEYLVQVGNSSASLLSYPITI